MRNLYGKKSNQHMSKVSSKLTTKYRDENAIPENEEAPFMNSKLQLPAPLGNQLTPMKDSDLESDSVSHSFSNSRNSKRKNFDDISSEH